MPIEMRSYAYRLPNDGHNIHIMTTISVSDFRQNLSDYLRQANMGATLMVKDDKKDENLAQIIPPSVRKWDPEAYRAMLKRVAGTFTAKNHPEWATKDKVEKWLRKSRMADERKFDVYS